MSYSEKTTSEKFQSLVGTPFYFPPADAMVKVDDHHVIYLLDANNDVLDQNSSSELSEAVIDRFFHYSEAYKESQRKAGVPAWKI